MKLLVRTGCRHPVLTKMLSIRKLHIQLGNRTRHRRNLILSEFSSSSKCSQSLHHSFTCIHTVNTPTHPKKSSISSNVNVLKLWAGNKCHSSSIYIFYVGNQAMVKFDSTLTAYYSNQKVLIAVLHLSQVSFSTLEEPEDYHKREENIGNHHAEASQLYQGLWQIKPKQWPPWRHSTVYLLGITFRLLDKHKIFPNTDTEHLALHFYSLISNTFSGCQ